MKANRVTIVDALNALNDSVSNIVAEHINGTGFVKKNGDTMTGGLKILDASLMVGAVNGYNITDEGSGKIVATEGREGTKKMLSKLKIISDGIFLGAGPSLSINMLASFIMLKMLVLFDLFL